MEPWPRAPAIPMAMSGAALDGVVNLDGGRVVDMERRW